MPTTKTLRKKDLRMQNSFEKKLKTPRLSKDHTLSDTYVHGNSKFKRKFEHAVVEAGAWLQVLVIIGLVIWFMSILIR